VDRMEWVVDKSETGVWWAKKSSTAESGSTMSPEQFVQHVGIWRNSVYQQSDRRSLCCRGEMSRYVAWTVAKCRSMTWRRRQSSVA
jgi:hypothetical protein